MAYAAILSVRQKIDRLLHPSSHSKIVLPHSQLFESINGHLFPLESILKEYICEMKGSKVRFDPLEQQIQDAADKIDLLLEDCLASGGFLSEPESGSVSYDLLQVKQQISSFTDSLKKKKKKTEEANQQPRTIDDAVPSRRIYDFGGESVFVGLDAEEIEVLDWAVRGSRKLRIMSVFGMVGIGKTALVRKIYDLPYVRNYFDLCVWVTVGQNYRLEEFLLQFINNAGIPIDVSHKKFGNDPDLGVEIHKFLTYRRYLIVLDDVWSIDAWDDLRRFLPDNENCSRIIMTSRLFDVAAYANTEEVYEKRFLDDEDSWSLLHRTVFTSPNEHCKFELQKFGRKIAQNCEGLPLAILAVGKQLRRAEKTVEYWEEVSEQENLRDIIKDDYADIVGPLALSYNMLPRRLKECFLYIGIVPNYKISVAELNKLWDVERFLPLQMHKSVKDEVEMFLKELVSHSVALVHERSSKRHGIKICRIHFVFRSLCVTEAQNEKFCYVMRKYKYSFPRGMNLQQRLSIHSNAILGIKEVRNTMESISSVRSLLCLGPLHPYPLHAHLCFRLLKVLHVLSIRFFDFPHQVLELVRLKYFALTYDGKLPESISQLWNLEVLIIGRYHSVISSEARPHLPLQIWDLQWLKHLHCMGIDLVDGCKSGVLEHLITLSGVSARSCSQGILTRVPNLEKLGIVIELGPEEVETLSFFDDVTELLHNLQSLKCTVLGRKSQLVYSTVSFPTSLRKLTLSGCRFPWEYMAHISCNLLNLEILKLRCSAFCGPRWDTRDEEFPSLELLLLEDLDIQEWVVEDVRITFPGLRRLMIKHCYKLHMMPMDIGDILTLVEIKLDDCSPCFASLVTEVQEEQKEMGNYDIQCFINESWDEKKLKSQS